MRAFLEKLQGQDMTLAVTWLRVIYAFRDICVNLMEGPSGAVADALGRRRAMIVCFLAYSGAFLVFGFVDPLWSICVAMFPRPTSIGWLPAAWCSTAPMARELFVIRRERR